MTRILKIILLILGSVILQTTLIAKVSIFGSKPDLPLILTISIALLKGSFQGELVGFVSGLLCDLSSGGPFLGIQSLGKVVVGYLAGFIKGRFYSDSSIIQSLSAFVATIVDKLITLLNLGMLLGGFLHIRLPGLILTAIINSILVIIVFRIVRRFVKSET